MYYTPRAGETMAGTVGTLPAAEMLLNATGNPHDHRWESGLHSSPRVPAMIVRTGARGLSFTNVVFEHATWMGPSTPIGFVDVQAGFCLACAVGEERNCLPDPGDSPEHPPPPSLKFRETPAALAFHGSKDVRFDSCTFQHLGANGVSFSGGSQNNTVARCTFVDLSASAVSRTIAANAALNFQRSERAGRLLSARGAIRRSAARSTSRTRATKSRTAASHTWRESTAATPRCWQASAAGKPDRMVVCWNLGPNDFSNDCADRTRLIHNDISHVPVK